MGSKVTKINTNLNFVTLLYCNIFTQLFLNLLQNTNIYILLGNNVTKENIIYTLSWFEVQLARIYNDWKTVIK